MVLAALLLASGGCNWKMPKVDLNPFKDDPPQVQVQKRIAIVLRSGNDDIAFHRAMAEMLATARDENWDAKRLLTEVLDYYPKVEGNDQLTTYHRMLQAMQVPPAALVAVAAPRLADAKAGEISQTMLRLAAPADPSGRTDFRHFADFLQANQNPLPQPLITWMYQRDPASAMWQLVAVYGTRLAPSDRRALGLGEHVISEIVWRQQAGLIQATQFDAAASDQLDLLSKFKEWYVRLYVAEVAVRNPLLAKPEMVNRLRHDENALVAQVMDHYSRSKP